MLRGLFQAALDAKGRLAIPQRHREQLEQMGADRLVMTIDLDHCLLLYPLATWLVIERQLGALPSLDRHARSLQRLLLGHAAEVEQDASGRILVPATLRQFAHLDKQVMVVGQGKKLELWDEKRWHEACECWLKEHADAGMRLTANLEGLSL
jgi:MraZ protein